MSTFRKILLTVVALILILVTALTWGSIGSVIMGFCLVMMCAALLVQRFLNTDTDSDFTEDQNG